jgi:nucleotide-binding universal stress UspA family protein
MALDTIVLCSDGSDAAIHALREGLARLQPASRVIIATATDAGDPSLVAGTGFAGGVMSADQYEEMREAAAVEGRGIAEHTSAALGLAQAELQVLAGDPGQALCAFASEVSASALVMGSRGRGGIKRALLGSVSDYVVRHAPCPVVITNAVTE